MLNRITSRITWQYQHHPRSLFFEPATQPLFSFMKDSLAAMTITSILVTLLTLIPPTAAGSMSLMGGVQ